MKMIGLIPARGGSKGIPGKNLKILQGKPLIAWSIEAAKSAPILKEVCVSTDDDEILKLTAQLGVRGLKRPPEFATDEAPMIGVLNHFLSTLSEPCDALMLLQPTSPLRTGVHIREAYEKFVDLKADSLVSVVEVAHSMHPWSVMKKNSLGFLESFMTDGSQVLRRQDKPQLWSRNGPAVVITTPALLRQGKLYGERCAAYEMKREDSVDIDDPLDFELADFLMQRRNR